MDWKDYKEIAEKLNEHYPNARIDSLALSNEDLKKMIVYFTGDTNASNSDFHCRCIRREWISIKISETFHVPDSAHILEEKKIEHADKRLV